METLMLLQINLRLRQAVEIPQQEHGVSNVTSITPAAITSSGEDDKVLNLTQTLNDSNAAGGSNSFRLIKANLTQTDVMAGITSI